MDKIQLCRDIKSYLLKTFDFQDSREASVITFWAIGTYFSDVFNAYPRLMIYGPKQSGKSKLLTFLSKICYNAHYTIIPSSAAMFRIVQHWKPTLLLDEFNLYTDREYKEVIAILRQGYKKGGKVPRCEKLRIKSEDGSRELQEVIFYEVYCPVAFAGLTINDDQLLDRCIAINLLRSNNPNIVHRDVDEVWFDSEKLVTWDGLRKCISEVFSKVQVSQSYEEFKKVYMPISGRDRELWMPLLAIGHCVNDGKSYDMWLDVTQYMQKYIKNKQEEDLSSFDLQVLGELERLDDLSRFQAKDVAELLNEGVTKPSEMYSSHAVGHALKRLGIKFRTINGKRYYSLTEEEYNMLKQRFGI